MSDKDEVGRLRLLCAELLDRLALAANTLKHHAPEAPFATRLWLVDGFPILKMEAEKLGVVTDAMTDVWGPMAVGRQPQTPAT